jgi:potassium efflux system protein
MLNALHLDWAKFGWIAGGLSVGIGFGLQEVVANFVCGVILLFERPIRVGDFVTVEGTTGTVTRIDMRATTITNTLLNWTLSATLNRILIPVGVAYGSDTEQARQIMLDVADDHPRVLEDPAPQATFEQFGDSSLNLVLRAFIPNLENRIRTITDLHTEIDKRFAAAGIEIAFPQRDVHIRNRPESSLADVRDSLTEASRVRGSEPNTAK